MSITKQVQIPQALFLKARQVRARYGGVSHMWLVRRQKDAGFPAPTVFGGSRFWKLSDLERWEKHQKTAREIRASNLPNATASNPTESAGADQNARENLMVRKPRAHIGSNDPNQLKLWATKFPGCNWGMEVDRACITVADLAHGRKPPTADGRNPVIVTASAGGTHHFYLSADRDSITDDPEIMRAKVAPASADGDADAAWFRLNEDQAVRVRTPTPSERNIDKDITVTIVRTLGKGIRIREFWMVPVSLVGYVLKYGERCLVDGGAGIVMPGSNVNGEVLAWSEDGRT